MTGPERPEILFQINPQEVPVWRSRKRLAIYHAIAALCDRHGLPYRAIPRQPDESVREAGFADGHLHIVEDGRRHGEGWPNTALAYLEGFWHLDPVGIQAESLARGVTFNPATVPLDPALSFFRGLRRRLADARVSRYNPPRERDDSIPPGAIALFMQGSAPYQAGHCEVPMHEIILAVTAGAGGGQSWSSPIRDQSRLVPMPWPGPPTPGRSSR